MTQRQATPDYDFFAPAPGARPTTPAAAAASRFGSPPGRFGSVPSQTTPSTGQFAGQFGAAASQFGTGTGQFGGNQFGSQSSGGHVAGRPGLSSAPAAPLPSSTGIPRGAVIAGSIVLTLLLGFFGLGRMSFMAPAVTTPQSLDGLTRDESFESLLEPIAASLLGDLPEDRVAIGVYSSGDRTLVVIPFRDMVTTSQIEELMAEDGPTQRVGDGVCNRMDANTLKCATAGFNSAAFIMEFASDPALASSPQHLVDLADEVRP